MEQQQHTETGAHGGESHVFPPFDTTTFPSQLLWLTIAFALLYMAVARLVLPKLAVIFERRRERIAADFDAARDLKAQTEAAISAYEGALRSARERANAIAQDMRDQIKADIEAERAKVETALNARIAEAEKQIAASRAKVLGEVEQIAAQTAEAIVEHLAGSANGDRISGAVKTALKKTA